MIAIIAKAMGSYPIFIAIGAKIAAVKSMIEIESMIIPSKNQIITITLIIIQGSIPEFRNTPSIAFAIPVIAKVLE